MRGLTAGSGWTHLIPGLIVAGAGAGLVNVPLASTAVGDRSTLATWVADMEARFGGREGPAS